MCAGGEENLDQCVRDYEEVARLSSDEDARDLRHKIHQVGRMEQEETCAERTRGGPTASALRTSSSDSGVVGVWCWFRRRWP